MKIYIFLTSSASQKIFRHFRQKYTQIRYLCKKMSPVFLTENGFRFFIWSKEKPRKHIHVIKMKNIVNFGWTHDVFDIEMIGNEGIRLGTLDVDLAIDSLIHPEKYPLIAKSI